MNIPPGPRYIASLSSQCIIPSTITYLSLRILCRILGVEFPTSGALVVSGLSKPLLFVIQHHLQPHIDSRAAKRLGAMLPPTVEGTFATAGEKVVQCVKTGYPGDIFNVWMEEHGPVYQVPSVGTPMVSLLQLVAILLVKDSLEMQILTFEPEHIKVILTQFQEAGKNINSLSRSCLPLSLSHSSRVCGTLYQMKILMTSLRGNGSEADGVAPWLWNFQR